MFKLNEIAVKIKQTNPPDKRENCLDKTLSSFILTQSNGNQSVILVRSTGIQPIRGCRVLKQTDSNRPCSLTYKSNFTYSKPARRVTSSSGGG